MNVRGTILLILTLALAPAAGAQKLRSAEQGSVPLTFDAFAPQQSTVTVRPGEVAWNEGVHPARAAKLIDETKTRVRPGSVPGVPVGTLLFGYQLQSGFAYCPPLDPRRSFKSVQCYRDLDGDGTFDGGYVTGDNDADSRYFSSFLKGLASVPKYKYETVSGNLLPSASGKVIFADMKNGAPRFRLQIDNETLVNLLECKVQKPGVCDVLGVRLTFAAAADAKDAITLTFEGSSSMRMLDVTNSTDPLKT